MTSFIEHSDDWHYQPPVPPRCYRGWWISNDDGEPMDGPYATREIAEEVLADELADMRSRALIDEAMCSRRGA